MQQAEPAHQLDHIGLPLRRGQLHMGGGAGDLGLVLLAVADLVGVGLALGVKGEPGWRGQPAVAGERLDLLEASRAASACRVAAAA